MTEDTTEIPTKKKKSRKGRKSNFVLAWPTETATTKDEDGNEIPGEVCYVVKPLPPGLTPEQTRSRASIERAIRAAVFDDGLKEYGNTDFVVLDVGELFRVDFVEENITRLRPPKDGENAAE